jgi:hypothetical protein
MTAAPNPLSREGFGDKLSPRPSRQDKLNTASATWRLPPCRARQIPGLRTQSPQNSGRNRPYTSYLVVGGIGFRANTRLNSLSPVPRCECQCRHYSRVSQSGPAIPWFPPRVGSNARSPDRAGRDNIKTLRDMGSSGRRHSGTDWRP